MNGDKLFYALKNGNLISANMVERGLACNCTCPSCNSQLVARIGNVRIPHFAHYKKNSCSTGYQTSLHLLAKELINQRKMIIIPPVHCDIFYENPNTKEGYYLKNEIIKKEKLLKNVNVSLERKEYGIIPDIIIQYDDYKLYVEIYVTHKVDDKKKQIVKNNDISMMEIDLSKENRIITKEELSKYLFVDASKSNWINNKIWNLRNREEYIKKEDFIIKREKQNQEKKEKEDREIKEMLIWRKKEQNAKIEKGICPSCDSSFVKLWDNSSHNFIYVCSKYCNGYSSLSVKHKNTIQKLLNNTPIINKVTFYLQNGKCPKCGNNLLIRKGKYGTFISCSTYPKCKAKVTKSLYYLLPNNLKTELIRD